MKLLILAALVLCIASLDACFDTTAPYPPKGCKPDTIVIRLDTLKDTLDPITIHACGWPKGL